MDEKLLESPARTEEPAPQGPRRKWPRMKGKKKWIALVLAIAVTAKYPEADRKERQEMDEKLLESPARTEEPAPQGPRRKWPRMKGKKKWIALVLAIAVTAKYPEADMSFSETFLLAMKNVRSSKMRTFLTMLGIIIGVTAVIVIVGLGSGTQGYIRDSFADMDTDSLNVMVMGRGSSRSVSEKDMYAMVDEHSDMLKAISPTVNMMSSVKIGGTTFTIAGVLDQQGRAGGGRQRRLHLSPLLHCRPAELYQHHLQLCDYRAGYGPDLPGKNVGGAGALQRLFRRQCLHRHQHGRAGG